MTSGVRPPPTRPRTPETLTIRSFVSSTVGTVKKSAEIAAKRRLDRSNVDRGPRASKQRFCSGSGTSLSCHLEPVPRYPANECGDEKWRKDLGSRVRNAGDSCRATPRAGNG